MSQPDEGAEARLERLAEQTAHIAPPPGFADRIALAVGGAEPARNGLWEVGRVALVAFAIAAALAVVWSNVAQKQVDQNALSAFDAIEVEQ
jgi:hypothetical protein